MSFNHFSNLNHPNPQIHSQNQKHLLKKLNQFNFLVNNSKILKYSLTLYFHLQHSNFISNPTIINYYYLLNSIHSIKDSKNHTQKVISNVKNFLNPKPHLQIFLFKYSFFTINFFLIFIHFLNY
jgi:hypothetical protein